MVLVREIGFDFAAEVADCAIILLLHKLIAVTMRSNARFVVISGRLLSI